MNAFFRKLRWFAHRDRREAEVREELEFHLTEDAEDRRANGLSDEQAQSAARRKLGNVVLIDGVVLRPLPFPRPEQLVELKQVPAIRKLYAAQALKNAEVGRNESSRPS
jgi:hypothetical protein